MYKKYIITQENLDRNHARFVANKFFKCNGYEDNEIIYLADFIEEIGVFLYSSSMKNGTLAFLEKNGKNVEICVDSNIVGSKKESEVLSYCLAYEINLAKRRKKYKEDANLLKRDFAEILKKAKAAGCDMSKKEIQNRFAEFQKNCTHTLFVLDNYKNSKWTFKEDLFLADAILKRDKTPYRENIVCAIESYDQKEKDPFDF